MKRVLLFLSVLFIAGQAQLIAPQMQPREIFDTAVVVLPQDTLYSPWLKGLGYMSECTFVWAVSGDGSGSIDSLKVELQFCFLSHWLGNDPDTSYLPPWDSLHTIGSDTFSYFPLQELQPYGWFPFVGWLRTRWINFDADTAHVYFSRFDQAGSD